MAAVIAGPAMLAALTLAPGCGDTSDTDAPGAAEVASPQEAPGDEAESAVPAEVVTVAVAYNIRGRGLMYGGDYAGALQDFDMAIALVDDSAWYYANRAVAHAFMGMDERSSDDFERALALGDYSFNRSIESPDAFDCGLRYRNLGEAYARSVYAAYAFLFTREAGCPSNAD